MIFAARSCGAEKIQVVMNSPDEEIFSFKPVENSSVRDPGKPFVIMPYTRHLNDLQHYFLDHGSVEGYERTLKEEFDALYAEAVVKAL